MNTKFGAVLLLSLVMGSSAIAQADRWQQRIRYTMNVDMDVTTNRIKGTSKIEYSNQ